MKTVVKDILLLAPETTWGEEDATAQYEPIGFVNDGSLSIDEKLEIEKGIGGAIGYYGVPEVKLDFSGFLRAEDHAKFASLFPDANFKPKSFTVKCGNSDVGFGAKLLGFVPSEIRLDGKAGEPLKFSVSGRARDAQPISITETPDTPSGTLDMWHSTSITIGGASYECSEFTLSYKQDVKMETDISVKPAGQKRNPHLLGWGLPEIELSVKIYLPYYINFTADSFAGVSAQITSGTLSIALSNLQIADYKVPVKGGDDLWVMELTFKTWGNNMVISG